MKQKLTAAAQKLAAAAAVLVLVGVAATYSALIAALIAFMIVAVIALVVRARWARYSAGGRIAAWRRRQHQGWAGYRNIRRVTRSAYTLTRRLAPGTPLLPLGTRGWRWVRQRIAVCRELSALYIGPPGYWKSVTLACHAADAPGALFVTSTKTELLLDTLPYRAGKGRIWIMNPDGYGNIPTTLAWSPLEGCISAQVAIRRAGDLVTASPRDKTGKDAWHEDRAARLLRYMLHAAALIGGTMHDVVTWVNDPTSPEPVQILSSPAAEPGWAAKLPSLIAESGDNLSSLVSSASAAIGWMDDPIMAAAACPPPGEGFSAWEFARSHDSVYMIGRNRPYGSLAPYFAALGAEIFEQLKGYAMETASGRLPVPATYVLDEMPLTCPMPVHDMLAEARGYLITLLMGIQSLSQLRSKWGDEDGNTIRSACPIEVFTGGEKRHDDLTAVSEVVGQQDTWHGTQDNLAQEPLMPPGALHRMRKGKAVILMPECKPVLASLPAIWKRPGHQRADLGHVTQFIAGQPVITATPAAPALTEPAPAPALESTSWPNARARRTP